MRSLTLAEKILLTHRLPQQELHEGADVIWPGDLIEVAVDLTLANDVTAPIAIREFRELGVSEVFDREMMHVEPATILEPWPIAS